MQKNIILRKLGNGEECPLGDGKIQDEHSRTAILNRHYKKNEEDDSMQIWHSDCYALFVTQGFDIKKAKTKLEEESHSDPS